MPAPAKFGARRPCDGRTGSLRIRMLSRRSPPAAETTPRGDLGDRPDRRPAYALQTLDQDATAPAVRAPLHAHVDTDDDLLSARMPRCAPVEDRGPATNSTSGGHLPVPPHDDRRTTPSKERARPRGHGRRGQASWICAPPPPRTRRMPAYEEVALADEATAPRGTAHAASQRPYPLSRLVV